MLRAIGLYKLIYEKSACKTSQVIIMTAFRKFSIFFFFLQVHMWKLPADGYTSEKQVLQRNQKCDTDDGGIRGGM